MQEKLFNICANGPDSDLDGACDPMDNCTLVANMDQRDTDSNLFGNMCDTDLNGDNITNGLDAGILKTQFLTPRPDADFNGDGVVNGLDMQLLAGSGSKGSGSR